jgi:hypothetical protein
MLFKIEKTLLLIIEIFIYLHVVLMSEGELERRVLFGFVEKTIDP